MNHRYVYDETAMHDEPRIRSNRQFKTGTNQLRKTVARKIKRCPLDRTVKRQSSGAILADLKHRLLEIYDLNAAGSVLSLGPSQLYAEWRRRIAGSTVRDASTTCA